MRDKLKNIEYFDLFIDEDTQRVIKFQNKLDANEVKEERILAVKTKIHDLKLGILVAKYSKGEEIDVLKKEYLQLLQEWSDVFCEESYNKNLKMISLAVLFNIEEDYLQVIQEMLHEKKIFDWLFEFLLCGQNAKEDCILLFQEDFAKLKEFTYNPSNIQVLIDYLKNDWYCENCGCYEAHKSIHNIYYGYWSFEAGAVVKRLGVEDIQLKELQYYPYDLVHYDK